MKQRGSLPLIQENIERLMVSRKLRMIPLAKKAGISKGLLWKIITDVKSNPTIHTLDRIAFAFDVPTMDLLR